eukprot:jgi/Botrbrau1/5387/Bobra.0346s0048.1
MWGVVSFSSAFMTKRGHFFVLRFLLGEIEAGYFPGKENGSKRDQFPSCKTFPFSEMGSWEIEASH